MRVTTAVVATGGGSTTRGPDETRVRLSEPGDALVQTARLLWVYRADHTVDRLDLVGAGRGVHEPERVQGLLKVTLS